MPVMGWTFVMRLSTGTGRKASRAGARPITATAQANAANAYLRFMSDPLPPAAIIELLQLNDIRAVRMQWLRAGPSHRTADTFGLELGAKLYFLAFQAFGQNK